MKYALKYDATIRNYSTTCHFTLNFWSCIFNLLVQPLRRQGSSLASGPIRGMGKKNASKPLEIFECCYAGSKLSFKVIKIQLFLIAD